MTVCMERGDDSEVGKSGKGVAGGQRRFGKDGENCF